MRWRLRRNYIWGDARSRIILAPSSGRGRRAKRGGVGIPACENPASRANLRPFGAPPSIGRRECPREPLPLEGAAERSEAGLASFFAAKPPPLCLPHAGKAVLSLCHPPQPALPLRGQAKEAQGASCASLIGMHFPAEIRCIHCLMSFRIAAEGKTALPEVFLFADIAFDRPAIEESTDIEE